MDFTLLLNQIPKKDLSSSEPVCWGSLFFRVRDGDVGWHTASNVGVLFTYFVGTIF